MRRWKVIDKGNMYVSNGDILTLKYDDNGYESVGDTLDWKNSLKEKPFDI